MTQRTVLAVTVLLLLAVPTGAGEIDFFTVSGTVLTVGCFEQPKPEPGAPLCRLQIEVLANAASDLSLDPGGSFTASVGCYEPAVADACRALVPGDAVLIAGLEVAGVKQATHVALLVHGEDDCVLCGFGHSALYEGLMIGFERVAEDTRCPMDLTCASAGHVIVELNLWIESAFLGSHKLTLGDGPGPDRIEVGPYLLRLAEVLPVPSTDILPIDPDDCSLVMQVAKSVIKDRGAARLPPAR